MTVIISPNVPLYGTPGQGYRPGGPSTGGKWVGPIAQSGSEGPYYVADVNVDAGISPGFYFPNPTGALDIQRSAIATTSTGVSFGTGGEPIRLRDIYIAGADVGIWFKDNPLAPENRIDKSEFNNIRTLNCHIGIQWDGHRSSSVEFNQLQLEFCARNAIVFNAPKRANGSRFAITFRNVYIEGTGLNPNGSNSPDGPYDDVVLNGSGPYIFIGGHIGDGPGYRRYGINATGCPDNSVLLMGTKFSNHNIDVYPRSKFVGHWYTSSGTHDSR